MEQSRYQVAVIGAGPAGLFGARELANLGADVVLFNRDLKPGGLAEYGIFFDKYTMKEGLRRQFRQVLDHPNITYYGNVTVGQRGDLSLDEIRAMGFQGVLVTSGAQGTKWLGIPGEELAGVYHAKDVVYYYNNLPPFSQREFRFGQRCVIIGAGNVMVDMAHYLIHIVQSQEVIALARRGPADIKFDRHEMQHIIANLDIPALDAEMARVAPLMVEVEQDPQAARAVILESLPKAAPAESRSRFRFEFLVSPVRLIGDDRGHVSAVEVEDNLLIHKGGYTEARGTGNRRTIEADTVIFAIGDTVDADFGLPLARSEYAKNPSPHYPMEGLSYEAYDPQAGQSIPGVFLAGWARQASSGIVGTARKDGTHGARALWQYLQTVPPAPAHLDRLSARLMALGKPIITRDDVKRLEAAEQAEAEKRGLPYFKFSSNEDMLDAMGLSPVTA
jgi:ferredoxin--NADP+ reductase